MNETNNGEGSGRGEPRNPLDAPLIRPHKQSLASGLRSSFVAGIVVAAPVAITIYIVYWFVTSPMKRLDSFVRSILPAGDSRLETITQAIPGFGLLVAILGIIVLGAFAKNFFGRAMIRFGETLLDSMPVIRNLYRFFKNVFETALQKSDRSFKEVALIQYPREGLWAVCFVVGEALGEINHHLKNEEGPVVSVFVPTVPNPTSGFLIYVTKSDLKPLKMSIEDAAKLVFSMGLVVPDFSTPEESVEKLEKLAAEAAQERRGLLSRLTGRTAG